MENPKYSLFLFVSKVIPNITLSLNKDHFVAIHLLIPQIENAIRKVLELIGGTTFKIMILVCHYIKQKKMACPSIVYRSIKPIPMGYSH